MMFEPIGSKYKMWTDLFAKPLIDFRKDGNSQA